MKSSGPATAALPAVLLTLGAVCGLCVPPVRAQRAEPLPKELEGIGVTEHLEAHIPLQLEFVNEDGRPVRLGKYFTGKRPVILTLNYYLCPMLCTLQLNGLVEAMRSLDWVPGREFEIVTVSFDPTETPRLARLKKRNYITEYGRPGAAAGWHFLTGSQESIDALTGTVGFRYVWNDEAKQWMHVAALVICAPDGRLSRYLYGVMYEPQTLRLGLLEASQGKIGSTIDRILMYCYHYDASKGRYAPAAMNIMRTGGVLTVILLGILLVWLWRRDVRRRKVGLAGS